VLVLSELHALNPQISDYLNSSSVLVLSELHALNPQISDRINPPNKTAGRQDQQDSLSDQTCLPAGRYLNGNIKTTDKNAKIFKSPDRQIIK
jgi:hypothetical protein